MKTKKSIKEIPKKRGRPATGKDPMFALRLPPDLTTRIVAFGTRNGIASRAETMRQLIERGLARSSAPRALRSAHKNSVLAERRPP